MTNNNLDAEDVGSWPPGITDIPKKPEQVGVPLTPQESFKAFLRIAVLMAMTVTINTLADTFSGEKMMYLFKDVLKLTASSIATIGIITNLGDYSRPFIGSLADIVPIFGYHRRSYYVIGAFVASLGYGTLALMPNYPYAAIIVTLTIMVAGGVMLMIMADAVMVTVGNKTGSVGTVQAIQQFVPTILSFLILAHLGGFVAQHWAYKTCFTASALVYILALPLVFLIDEKKVLATQQVDESKEEHEARLELKKEERNRTLQTLRTAAKSVELWAIVGFIFYLIITPSLNNAQFFFQVNYLGFTKQQIGDLGRPGSLGTMIGIVLFGIASRYISVKSIVWGAWILDCLSYVIMLGLHNYTTGLIVAFVGGLIGIIYTLCLFTLAARACPPGIEGTVYGLAISAIGLGGTVGEKIGDSIFGALGGNVMATISHAWHLSLIIGLIATLPAALFIPFLPKWTKSNERLKSSDIREPKPA